MVDEVRPKLKRAPWESPPTGRHSLRSVALVVASGVQLMWRAAPPYLIAMVGLQVGGAAGSAYSVLVIRDLVAGMFQPGSTAAAVGPRLILLALLFAFVALLGGLQRQLQIVMAELVTWHTNERLLDITTSVELRLYDDPDFHNRLERAVQSAGRPFALTQSLLGLVGSLLTLLRFCAALVVIQPLLIPVALVGLVPLWASSEAATRARRELELGLTESNRRRGYLSWIMTSGYGAKDVRAYRLDQLVRPMIRALFLDRLRQIRSLALRGVFLTTVGSLGLGVGVGLTVGAIVWLVVTGRMSVASAAAAAAAMVQLGPLLAGIGAAASLLYENVLYVEDYEAFTAMLSVADGEVGGGAGPADLSEITVDNVSFTCPSGQTPAIRDVSMRLRRNEIVALVGSNGSGKTTLAKLLSRLYAPTAGRILWDGADTAEMDPDSVRKMVAVVFQELGQFWLSVRQNIGYGRLERMEDQAAIEEAATRSGADTFIRGLTHQYRAMLGPIFEGGHDLSVGQWQKIALARAFFRGAPLLILDEPTAALDARAEHDLFQRIRELCAGRAVLLISHRFSTVRDADRIYVLDAGTVLEQGSHGPRPVKWCTRLRASCHLQ
jgi:ATP-binding cassette, subfamily B, bacterial